ncbi:MAG: hypothetical protein WCO93_04855 [bacterium]
MGFEDFFEHRNKDSRYDHHDDHHQSYYNQTRYRDDHYPSRHGHDDQNYLLNILSSIKNNPKLRSLVIVAGIIILVIAVILIIALLPLIIKLINYIGQIGLQGIIDGITGFIDKILKGSGK